MFKRQMDLILSLIAVVVLSPVLLGVSAILYLTQGGPVFFSQPRVGYKGRIFNLYKFRTMKPLEPGQNPHGMDRLTTFGKLVRSLSIDELPSLLNIIKGEMSVVGPRPLLVHYLDRYSQEEMRRHDVLPGLTGWAQVNGRNTISWADKFRHDVWYVDHASFWLDIKIILLTIKVTLWRSGINATTSDIMEEFDPGLYVIGCGGHGKVVIATLQALDLKVMGIFDDSDASQGKCVLGVPVIGKLSEIKNFKVKKAIIGIGSNEVRERIAREYPLSYISVIHPEAIVHPSVEIGHGTVVFAGAIIQPDTVVGEHSIVNTGVVIEHDCRVGNFSHLCPGTVITGGVQVGQGAMLGTGVNVIPGKKVGDYSTVGAGSVIIKDIDSFSVAVGAPAKIIKTTVSYIQRKNA